MKNFRSFSVFLLLVFTIASFRYTDFKKRDTTNPFPIAWDVFGYYLYLPATFIYNDLGLENADWQEQIREKYNPSSTGYQLADGRGNKKVIIYNIGYAFINAPGFFIANMCCEKTEKDGFSKPYQLALQFTAFFLTLIGLYLFRKILLYFFSDTIVALLLIMITIGSNYFFQVVYDSTMPHNILFTLNCFIIWFTIKWYETKKTKHLLLLSVFIGLASICRPTELIWILLPAFWNVYDKQTFFEKRDFFRSHSYQVKLFSIVLTGILFIQLAYLTYATGNFIAVNYHSESFSFLDPYTFKFLFSYRKGWLLYTPIMAVAIIGFYFFRKYNQLIWFSFFLFFVVNLYIVSSWECWWYGPSYSQRPMVETYAMIAIPLGYFLVWLSNRKMILKITLFFVFSFLIILNIFQTWQFIDGIIDSEHMTKEYYWRIFAKTYADDTDRQYLSIDRNLAFTDYPDYLDKYTRSQPFYIDFETPKEGIRYKNIVDTIAQSGKKSFVLKDKVRYSIVFEKRYDKISDKSYIWVRASVWVYLIAPYTESNSCLVITSESKGKSFKYETTYYKDYTIPLRKWTEIHLDYMSPEIRHSSDKIKIYFWNMGKKPVFIDNLKVEVFQPKFDPS